MLPRLADMHEGSEMPSPEQRGGGETAAAVHRLESLFRLPTPDGADPDGGDQ